MKHARLSLSVLCAAWMTVGVCAGQDDKIGAAWPGVFPEVRPQYSLRFEKPRIDKDRWQQSARYEWTGGRLETIRVTLLRDAAEAKKYQFGDKNPPPDQVKKLKVGDRDGWEYPGGKLVIHLASDRLLILEAPTWKFFQSNLPEFAKRFPLDACAKALETPPKAP